MSLWKTPFHTDVLVFSTKMSHKVKTTHSALWGRINIQSPLGWGALLKSDALVTVRFLQPVAQTHTSLSEPTLLPLSQIICCYFWPHRVVVTLLFTSFTLDGTIVLWARCTRAHTHTHRQTQVHLFTHHRFWQLKVCEFGKKPLKPLNHLNFKHSLIHCYSIFVNFIFEVLMQNVFLPNPSIFSSLLN